MNGSSNEKEFLFEIFFHLNGLAPKIECHPQREAASKCKYEWMWEVTKWCGSQLEKLVWFASHGISLNSISLNTLQPGHKNTRLFLSFDYFYHKNFISYPVAFIWWIFIQFSTSANLWLRMITIESDGLWNQNEIFYSVFEIILQLVRIESFEMFKYHNEKGKKKYREKQAQWIRRVECLDYQKSNRKKSKHTHKDRGSVKQNLIFMVFNYVPLRMHLKIRIIYKWIAVVDCSNREANEWRKKLNLNLKISSAVQMQAS